MVLLRLPAARGAARFSRPGKARQPGLAPCRPLFTLWERLVLSRMRALTVSMPRHPAEGSAHRHKPFRRIWADQSIPRRCGYCFELIFMFFTPNAAHSAPRCDPVPPYDTVFVCVGECDPKKTCTFYKSTAVNIWHQKRKIWLVLLPAASRYAPIRSDAPKWRLAAHSQL